MQVSYQQKRPRIYVAVGWLRLVAWLGEPLPSEKKLIQPPATVTMQDDMDKNRIVEYYQNLQHDQNGVTPERSRLVGHLRDHCSGKIPGYTGFIPRVHGESIYGARGAEANRLAADLCEDRVFNPSDHGKACCAPQFPQQRKLRI
jgi:hypothetical protein